MGITKLVDFKVLLLAIFAVSTLMVFGSTQYASAGGDCELSVTDGDAFLEWCGEDVLTFSFKGVDHVDETEIHLCAILPSLEENLGGCDDEDLDGEINDTLSISSTEKNEALNTITIIYVSEGQGDMLSLTATDIHPPLYYALLTGWQRLAGSTPASARLLSILFGTLLVPLAYPFPNAGKILSLLFIPFAAWFIGEPLALLDYPLLLSVGLVSFFGSPVAAIPFLLGVFRLPVDLLPLFLVAGIWCARCGSTSRRWC